MSLSNLASASSDESAMNLTIVNPPGLYNPAPNGYSHAVIAEGGSHIAYVAGQGGENANGELSPRFVDQVKQAYDNLRSVLEAIGATPCQVAKLTTYVVDYCPSQLPVMTRHVRGLFGDALPAQTLVPVPRLALDGMLFEVDAMVVMDETTSNDSIVQEEQGSTLALNPLEL